MLLPYMKERENTVISFSAFKVLNWFSLINRLRHFQEHESLLGTRFLQNGLDTSGPMGFEPMTSALKQSFGSLHRNVSARPCPLSLSDDFNCLSINAAAACLI